MKVFLLGLDGADWDMMEPLIQEGLMPNLARLRDEGASGSLRSVFPPLSPGGVDRSDDRQEFGEARHL